EDDQPRRHAAGVAPELPHDRRLRRPTHAAAQAVPAAQVAAPPLSAGRADRSTAAGRHDARRVPPDAQDDARGARRLGRRLPALRRRHRPQLPSDEGGLGALVGSGRRRPPRVPGRHRQAILHAAELVAPEGDGAVPAQASRAPARAPVKTTEKYDAQSERWSERAYADSASYLAHRAEAILQVGPQLHEG